MVNHESQLICLGELLPQLEKTSGYAHYLLGGSLLGAVREQGFISHDYDIDLGIFLGQTSSRVARKKFAAYLVQLSLEGFCLKFLRNNGTVRRNYVKIECPKHSVQIDVFPSHIYRRKIFVAPLASTFELAIEQILPFRKVVFERQLHQAPADSEAFLASTFGPNWRIPDKNWKPNQNLVRSNLIRGLELSKKQMLHLTTLMNDHAEKEQLRMAVVKHLSVRVRFEQGLRSTIGGIRHKIRNFD